MMKIPALALVLVAAALCGAAPNSIKSKASISKTPKPKVLVTSAAKLTKPDKSKLILLYTSSAGGLIRSCNCTKFRFGGYGREMTLLRSIRSEGKGTVLIEGGDLCGGDGFQAKLKAGVSAKAMGALSYNAVVPGEIELNTLGNRYIGDFDPKAIPIICANLFLNGQDKPEFKSSLIIKAVNGLKVGVIGLIEPSLFDVFTAKKMAGALKEPAEVLRSAVKAVRAKSDIVVVVYHGVPDKAKSFASIKGVDLILCTHRQDGKLLFPSKESNIVDAPIQKLGATTIINSETRENWSLGRVDINLTKDRKIESVKHRLFYLDRRYAEDLQMIKIYDAYNDKVRYAVLNSSATFRKNAEKLLVKRGLNLVEMRKRLRRSPFATAEKCKECHSKEYDVWAGTRHAVAMATLEKGHQEYDPECINCHVTGAIANNGYTNRKETPELVNVQCEACHGPAAEHVKSPAKGFGKTGEDTCRSCHTDERTPDFDFEAAWNEIKH